MSPSRSTASSTRPRGAKPRPSRISSSLSRRGGRRVNGDGRQGPLRQHFHLYRFRVRRSRAGQNRRQDRQARRRPQGGRRRRSILRYARQPQRLLFFWTNLLGTQHDGRIVDNGLTTDSTWDGIWRSAARRTETGWTVEMAIELASLKYKPGRRRDWGLGLVRSFPRRLENSCWQGAVDSISRVSQFGRLSGLELERAAKRLQVGSPRRRQAGGLGHGRVEAGLDARYAFSQTVSGNLTLNPDFATVEATRSRST